MPASLSAEFYPELQVVSCPVRGQCLWRTVDSTICQISLRYALSRCFCGHIFIFNIVHYSMSWVLPPSPISVVAPIIRSYALSVVCVSFRFNRPKCNTLIFVFACWGKALVHIRCFPAPNYLSFFLSSRISEDVSIRHLLKSLNTLLNFRVGISTFTTIFQLPVRIAQMWHYHYNLHVYNTRNSADADNRLDAFTGQSRSTNMVPFHMLHIVSYCAIVTLSLRRVFTIFVFKKFHDLEMGVKGHSRSLRVVSFDRLCMVSY